MQTPLLSGPVPALFAESSLRSAPAGTSAAMAQDADDESAEEQAMGTDVAPGRPRTSAVVRRVGPPAAGTSSVDFPEHPGLKGMLRYLGHFPACLYEVTDHLDQPVTPDPVAGGLEAVTALARHYGLPLDIQVIPRGPRGHASAARGTA
ncbi:hypothetical protein OG871_40520 (plasmid) [Kitasatospora sp. NBC_00374]|uniref:hypothetical protein n=1 Tax=Kitasatospora sp. NBC_00374 TaxID=2975964 RepID=UPI002F917BBD